MVEKWSLRISTRHPQEEEVMRNLPPSSHAPSFKTLEREKAAVHSQREGPNLAIPKEYWDLNEVFSECESNVLPPPPSHRVWY